MSTSTTATAAREVAARATASAALLYWLVLLCGLEGLTIVRSDTQHLGALWVGSLAGVGLGQLVGWLRVRAWLLVVIMMGGLWLTPILYNVLYSGLDRSVETLFCAFVPAAICGYLALSERGALIAFWYPAVLWMLVLLDGPGSFDARTALPFGVGLAALFIAYVRARETRRTALWRSHASTRLGKPRPRSVLRTSPFRTTAQLGWTALVGVSTLVLTAWIAPHLWQKDASKPVTRVKATAVAAGASEGYGYGSCCSLEEIEEARRVRFREYFPLGSGHEEVTPVRDLRTCEPCSRKHIGATASCDLDRTNVGKYPPPAYDTWDPPPSSWGATTHADSTPTSPSLPTTPAAAPETPWAAAPTTDTPAATTTTATTTTATTTTAAAIVARRTVPSTPLGAPWRSALALCGAGLGLHLLLRALRRKLTLRHLARPFWTETLDQRISNHWERALIGLRDAGIHSTDDEQPHALARRVGIEELETCATILERVRHGVRVDAADLDTMSAASAAVYRAARDRAGPAARAASWLRPLS